MSINHLPVLLTDRAREEVYQIFQHKNIPKGYGLRIGVKGGGCAGVTYVIGFDKPKQNDDIFKIKDGQKGEEATLTNPLIKSKCTSNARVHNI